MPPNIEKKEVTLKNQEVPEPISKGINDDLSIDIVKDLLNPPVLFSSDSQPIIPFFTSKYVFSNHYPAKFTLVNHDYHCTEQYYQFMKVHTNERKDLDQKILEESDPKIIKKIADEIEVPDLERWSKLCWKVMLKCNLEKYMTHQNLRVQLFRTLGATLVEASPTDDYWGVGMSIDDPDLANKSTWKGHNMMGQVLMEIRDYLVGLPEFEKEVALAKKHLIADTQTRHKEGK
ncbi:hypothetical protein WR25_22979 [Diploscapter pachys]|uniref:NADAR domain-containing protein n=1 Tax=Diploscapter pachys TaxID=2018661 RepID=A0A2A2JM39_9BILA|nr:hypothetical protein WR25_22979 [Diploscapter pachys]